jgi:Calcium-activated BK potassium channel alpha subunit
LTTDVILLNSSEPSAELESLLADSIYSNRVKYVKGSAMSFRSLGKAKAGTAKAAFVLASRISDCEPIEEDAKTVMRCVSLRKFHRSLKIFAQILLPRNKIHLENLADHILCIDEFRLGMAAQSCLAPGFPTLLYILTNSISERAVDHLSGYGKASSWMQEYLNGAVMELYEVKLDIKYAGMKFTEAVVAVYKHHNAILFGLGFDCAPGEDGTFGADQKIVFNPESYVLQGGETGFLITDESKNARRVGRFDFRLDRVDHSSSFWDQSKLKRHIELNLKRPAPPLRDFSVKIRRETTGSLESIVELKPKLDFTVVSSKKGKAILDKVASLEEEVKISLPITVDPAKEISETNIPFVVEDISLITNAASNAPDSFELGSTLPSSVKDHIIYCCLADIFPTNLLYFVGAVRQKDTLIPIVFLCKAAPVEEDWLEMKDYGNVFYIVGNPLLRRDLRKAGLQFASRTMCFTDPDLSDISDRTADASTLLALMNIQALATSSSNFVTVEFLHIQNMKLIGNYNHSLREAAVSDATELEMQNIIPGRCFLM